MKALRKSFAKYIHAIGEKTLQTFTPPQTLARHSSQRPGGKRKTRTAQKTTVPHATLKITITQNRNCRKREYTQAPNTAVATGNTHKKKTSKGHALLLRNPETLLPVMAMEKDEANYNKQLTRRIPFSQGQKRNRCANEEGQITRWVLLTNARRRIKTRQ